MAVQRFKVALNNARFPLVSTQAQRAVFIPGLDSAPRTPRQFMGEDENIDYNLAQVIYSENVMPASQGLVSVGYKQLIAPTIAEDFDSIFALRDADENTVLYSPGAGKNYVYDASVQMWESRTHDEIFSPAELDTSFNTPDNSRVTYAYVDGKTFVCYSRLRSTESAPAAEDWTDMSLMFWDSEAQELVPAGDLIVNVPFGVGEIDGVSSSNGYLLIWSGLSVAWAPFNGTAFDFEIYANGNFTGAGNQIPEDVQGNIRALIPLAGGFAIFTDKNAIAANYHAQSIAAPWVFREIPAAGGLESYEQATVEGTLGQVIALTTAGVQRISLNSSEHVHADLSDFLTARRIERYVLSTQTLYTADTTLDFFVKVTAAGNRYIVVSYGTFPGVYSFALVYDLALERWGKLRVVHRDCFYYAYGPETAGLTYGMLGDITYDNDLLDTYEATQGQGNAFTSAPHSIAFLKRTGEVVVADWSHQEREVPDEGVAIIGRVQLSRSRAVQLNRAEVDGMRAGNVYVQPAYNGGKLSPAVELIEVLSEEEYRTYGGLIDCTNFNLIVQGTFSLSSIILEATIAGRM